MVVRRSFVRLFVRSFLHSFLHSFVHVFVRLFNYCVFCCLSIIHLPTHKSERSISASTARVARVRTLPTLGNPAWTRPKLCSEVLIRINSILLGPYTIFPTPAALLERSVIFS